MPLLGRSQCCKLANCSPVCGWFAEGYFDTLDDLKEAKALFDE